MVDYSKIQINLISKDTFDKMSSSERLEFIINEVKQGKVLILEQGLTPSEQMELNKLTMSAIDHESFIGVEMPGFSSEYKKPGIFDRLFRRQKAPRMMAVGPAKVMKIIKKEPSLIQTIISPTSETSNTGQGIPLDENGNEIAPEAIPADDEAEMPESQSRLEEFEINNKKSIADHERREELAQLIGPELRETQDSVPGNDTGTARAENEAEVIEQTDRPEMETDSEDEIKSDTRGYILRKIKEEGDEE